jgi:hypothetical protein
MYLQRNLAVAERDLQSLSATLPNCTISGATMALRTVVPTISPAP